MESNLLKEAIADAKAVRATALANAKVALEEAFAPRFHAMFADKLKEDAGVNERKEEQEEEEDEAKKPTEESVNEAEIDALIKELENEVGDDVAPAPDAMPPVDTAPGADVSPTPGVATGAPIPAGVPVIITPVDQTAGAGVPPVSPVPPSPEVPPTRTPEEEEGEEEQDEEVDLNELLESLKEEAEEQEEGKEEEESIKENVPVKSSGIATGDNKEPSKDAHDSSNISDGSKDNKSGKVGWPDGEKKSSDQDATVTRPNQGPNAKKDNLSTPGGALKEGIGLADKGIPGGKQTSSDEDANVDRPNKGEHAQKDDLSTPALAKENVMLKKQLGEAMDTITYVKGQLNEINLLNAKLLYTNKLFKEFNMNNEQKMRVVEMFDLSKNVREVKLTYATVAESINFSGDMKKKVRPSTSVQSITEGIASKPVGSTKPSREIISSQSAMVSKFQKLAGIKIAKK